MHQNRYEILEDHLKNIKTYLRTSTDDKHRKIQIYRQK